MLPGSERLTNRAKPLPPLAAGPSCSAAAQSALDQVVAIRGSSELEAALCARLDDLAAAQLARGLREMGVAPSASF